MLDPKHSLWIDFETSASAVSLKTAGAVRYAADPTCRAIVLAWAVDDGPAETWHADGDMLDWHDAPQPLKQAFISDRPVVAWNSGFDRAIWNNAAMCFPHLDVRRVYDAMVQATASSLPADLDGASIRLGGGGKQADGAALIKLFSVECARPADHPEEWQRFLSYARRDIETMRGVIMSTRPLSESEWREFHAFERVNDRGIEIDLPFVRNAAELAAGDRRYIGRRLSELTGGGITAVTQVARIAQWLHGVLPQAEARAILEDTPDPDDDDEDDEEPGVSLTRSKAAALRVLLGAKRANGGLSDAEMRAEEVVTLREFGGSAAPAKFARMAAQQVGGVISNQYVFNGASQTGRMSSRGIQIHNLARDTVGVRAVEARLVDMVADGYDHAAFAAAEPATMPVARKLALMVRAALVAGAGKTFVWSDWSAIEARITPWLSGSPGGNAVLDIFRGNDADSRLPDIYRVAAAGILGKPAGEVSKMERQTGKVSTLALGFGGGRRALQSMAIGYGLFLDNHDAAEIVDRWRAENPWAPTFWRDLWDAAMRAWAVPGVITVAGRIAFKFEPAYLGSALFMALPSGRLLIYPNLKWRTTPVLDAHGRQIGQREELTFRRAHGRARLWHGTLCENAVQATAADLLRGTVARLVEDRALDFMPVRGHTHDEILTECDEPLGSRAAAILRRHMLIGFDWSRGLPLACEETISPWYSKAKAE